MSALARVLDGITKKASEQADGILREAAQKAEEIRSKGEVERRSLGKRMEDAASRERGEVLSRARSADRQNRRRALLETRARAVSDVLCEAKEKLINLPDADYCDFLLRLFEKYAQPRDGIIRVGGADCARISDEFLDRCKRIYPGHALALFGEPSGTGHGFVIEYGNIVQNCMIDSIFESEAQALCDRAYEVLTTDTARGDD
ncbi:MAG: V-type ATP synthase subunit E [Clostridia bacterium]|nr:V-type ATP synthase subunit E [Clostridia bacterium]